MTQVIACGARMGDRTTFSYVQGGEKITITTEKATPPTGAPVGNFPYFAKERGSLG
jgi:hypothetical protein